MNKRILVGLIAFILLTLSIPINTSYANTDNTMNIANNLMGKINQYEPTELEVVEGVTVSPSLRTYGRMARYIYYVNKLEELIEENTDSVSIYMEESLNSHKSNIEEYASHLNVSGGYDDYLNHLIEESKSNVNEILDAVESEPDRKESLYRENFEKIQLNIKYWSDSIRFLNDENLIENEAEAESMKEEFNATYDIVANINLGLGLNMSLDQIRPEEQYNESESIAQNIMDTNGNLKSWYIEIMTLSAHTEVNDLESYKDKLSENAKKFYEEYKDYRVPLYMGNEREPIKALYEKGNKTIVRSNLREFLDYSDSEVVFYIPRYKGGDESPVNTVSEEIEEVDFEDSDVEYSPIYVKGSKLTLLQNRKSFDTEQNDVLIPGYQSAIMNHLQFNNAKESGKFNDLQSDLSYPLFIDIWGNIQTYSGKIIIPAVSNMVYFNSENYFPLNAFFLNNYPMETSLLNENDSRLSSIFKPNPNKYVVLFSETFSNSDEEPLKNIPGTGTFRLANFDKKGGLKAGFKVGVADRLANRNFLPNIVNYIEQEKSNGGIEKIPFMSIVEMNNEGIIDRSSYNILGLKETALLIDGTEIPFMLINENIPVEKWNYSYLYGSDGDKRKLKNDLMVMIAESAKNNPDTNFAQMKVSDSQKISYGFKVGAMLEPLHKNTSEAVKNYVLYTPSIAELPGIDNYISTLLIPFLRLALLIALIFTLLKYIKNAKTMRLSNLIVSIAVLVFINFAVTSFYPAILNTGFNGIASRLLGKQGYMLSLYNIEKDLNSKGEFVYGDGSYNEKIINDGAYVKLAELDKDEVKRFRAAQENSPYKDTDYYVPQWDTSHAYIGANSDIFIKGTSLYIHIKDLTSSVIMSYNGNTGYDPVWETIPSYTYYTPYLSILEGVTKSVNTFTNNRVSPKRLEYSTGHQTYTGLSLAYFSSKYFIVDNESAMSDEEFRNNWEIYNGGDFLNLRNVLYLDADNQNFPMEREYDVRSSRWYKTAMRDYHDLSGREKEERDQLLENKILKVNARTKEFIYDLIPYMDNIGDDMILKIISMYATVEFNKEFSRNPAESLLLFPQYARDSIIGNDGGDYFTQIYPKRLELDSISIDEQMKLSLVNVDDLLKFNITSIYKSVENTASWLGMLLLGANGGLLHIRSILRISLISVTLVVVLMYMVLVYALQRDYTNKTIVALIGILSMSWGVYFIDNLLMLMFTYFDKSGAGVLLLILTAWLLWNIIATASYVLIFDMIRRDISAFGGNIIYGAMSSALNKANGVIKSGLGLVSKTRAENFDISSPAMEMKTKEYENYLNMDYNEKLLHSQRELGSKLSDGKDSMYERLDSKIPNGKTLKEVYAESRDKGYNTMSLTTTPIIATKAIRDYMKSYGIENYKNPNNGQYVFEGGMEDWEKLVKSNTVKSQPFELYKENEKELFFPNNKFITKTMNKAGIQYTEIGKSTIAVSKNQISNVRDMQDSLKAETYKVLESKSTAIDKVEGVLNPNDYEIGNNALYLKDRDAAEKLFGNNFETQYVTQNKLVDYTDKISSGYITDNLDINNGVMVTNEFVYGKLSKDVLNNLLNSEIDLTSLGSETYRFDRENRDKVVEAVNKNVSYTEGNEGVIFRNSSAIDNLIFWDEAEGVTENTENKENEKTYNDRKEFESDGNIEGGNTLKLNQSGEDKGKDKDDIYDIDLGL